MRVLDVGCGTGDDVRAIAQLVGSSGHSAGIDASECLIDEARRRGVPDNASFTVATATRVPFDDASFDAVRAERVFQHVADPLPAALEMRRVLRRDGTALLLDQDWESLCIAGGRRDVTRAIVRAFADRFANGWAGRSLRGTLLRAGFARAVVAPMVATPELAVAFDLILRPALEAAVASGNVDSLEGEAWLQSLVDAQSRGEFFCMVTVVVALAYAAQ